MRAANNVDVGHTTDTFTKRTALFSGIEVKPTSGDKAEAELQMSIWIAASLRKKAELAKRVAFKATLRNADVNVSANERNPNPAGDGEDTCETYTRDTQSVADCPSAASNVPILVTLPEPALTIVGHEHYIYYAYLDSADNTHILGPDIDRFGKVSTRSIRGIFALVRLYGRILEYGMDEHGFGGHILGWVLEGLAGEAHR